MLQYPPPKQRHKFTPRPSLRITKSDPKNIFFLNSIHFLLISSWHQLPITPTITNHPLLIKGPHFFGPVPKDVPYNFWTWRLKAQHKNEHWHDLSSSDLSPPHFTYLRRVTFSYLRLIPTYFRDRRLMENQLSKDTSKTGRVVEIWQGRDN